MSEAIIALSTEEIQALNLAQSQGICAALTAKIKHLQNHPKKPDITFLQSQKATADTAIYIKLLENRSTPIKVSAASTILRQDVEGQNSLIIQTP